MTGHEQSPSTETSKLLPEGEVLRLNEWGQGIAVLVTGLAALGGLFLIFVPAVGHGHLEGASRRELGVAWLLVAAFFFQTARAGLIVEKEGITVRGLLRRRQRTWQQIDGFEMTTAFFIQPLRINFRDGSHLRAPGFKASSTAEREVVVSRVAELNRRARAAVTEQERQRSGPRAVRGRLVQLNDLDKDLCRAREIFSGRHVG
jgi:hypothetical protein